ncbi:di-heme oxidoredictase family protein [Roseovarius sp. SK2]|uniref:di-heme oxidoreductase family protein n=1 Tax=Roseovarius TaxID=74030 RepID=UPI00237C4C59|nr:di-heme oxidoredictase family protein [Roseovarius sp. SK2]MDD9725233.1 di-heme oxidoredictase family protein [Roseovarius sp. SK2]
MRKPLIFLLPLAAALFIPVAAHLSETAPWSGLADVHLDIIPRTEAERARIAAVTARPTDFSAAWAFEQNPAGGQTVRARNTPDAFSQPAANLTFEQEMEFKLGNGMFERVWVSAPASALASDGLGPLYNARSCQRCHLKDGRGHPPEGPDDSAVSMFLRVSVPAAAAEAEAIHSFIEGTYPVAPEPTYGSQLQDFSLPGHAPEYRLQIDYEEIEVVLSGGEVVTLRDPAYTAADLGYGPLHEAAMISPRVAPQMIGMGLLEAIPTQDILAWADPEDMDGDGISGRPQVVWSDVHEQPMLGRFGLKAGNPTVLEQSASAFAGDIGISNPVHPAGSGECTDAQTDCTAALHGGDAEQGGHEIDQVGLDLVTFYSRTLAVPARRDVEDARVLLGREVFFQTGCADCHRPNYVTHRLKGDNPASFQLIWPFTDMLLHDMGPGLADNRPEGRASGQEWRTAPLWGIGMTETVSGHTYFLHDGRARSLLEAILWHGGEAQAARDRVVDMPPANRDALIRYLESL